MKGKPIEPGCLAMIIRVKNCKENLGRVVQVLHQPRPFETLPGDAVKINPWSADTWFVAALPGHADLEIPVVESSTRQFLHTRRCPVAAVLEKKLIRIDDNDENLDRVVEQSKPAITAKPIEEIF